MWFRQLHTCVQPHFVVACLSVLFWQVSVTVVMAVVSVIKLNVYISACDNIYIHPF